MAIRTLTSVPQVTALDPDPPNWWTSSLTSRAWWRPKYGSGQRLLDHALRLAVVAPFEGGDGVEILGSSFAARYTSCARLSPSSCSHLKTLCSHHSHEEDDFNLIGIPIGLCQEKPDSHRWSIRRRGLGGHIFKRFVHAPMEGSSRRSSIAVRLARFATAELRCTSSSLPRN